MKKQRGNALVFLCLCMVGLLGLGFSFMVNNAVENRYIEDCLQSGGKIEIQTKHADTMVGTGDAIRKSIRVKVCTRVTQ